MVLWYQETSLSWRVQLRMEQLKAAVKPKDDEIF
jgi:hypothetical protein